MADMAIKELRGKWALVTGAASGIGRATAQMLSDEGAELVLCDVNEKGLAALATELRGVRLARTVDVGDREAMRKFAEEVHRLVPALDVLVNNAGVGSAGGILDTTLEDWDWTLRVNLWGVIHGCHFFAPKMAARGSGHIVNVASGLGLSGAPGVIAYATSKFGVVGLSESMRAELAGRGVGVSAICPGFIRTAIVEQARFSGGADKKKLAAEFFVKRGRPPEAVAAAVRKAILRNAAVVPVAPEAWVAWYAKRFAPGVAERVGRMGAKMAFKVE